jgi:hypothetical protein
MDDPDGTVDCSFGSFPARASFWQTHAAVEHERL